LTCSPAWIFRPVLVSSWTPSLSTFALSDGTASVYACSSERAH
jgi:hypothetical protein